MSDATPFSRYEPQPLPDYCFECDDSSRCASTEICYAGHKEYPKLKAGEPRNPSSEAGLEQRILLLSRREFDKLGDGYVRLSDVLGIVRAALAKEARDAGAREPIYECASCHHEFEIIRHRVKEVPCPSCGKPVALAAPDAAKETGDGD